MSEYWFEFVPSLPQNTVMFIVYRGGFGLRLVINKNNLNNGHFLFALNFVYVFELFYQLLWLQLLYYILHINLLHTYVGINYFIQAVSELVS